MAMQKFKMYVSVGVGEYNRGSVFVQSGVPTREDDLDFGRKVLSVHDCEFDVPEFDPVTLEVESLEKAIQRERADSQVRINIMLDRISKLTCITHESEAK